MSFLQEKLLVPIIIGLILLLMGANPWKLDIVQRASGTIALIAVGIFISRTISLSNEKETKPTQKESAIFKPDAPSTQIISHDQQGGITAQTVVLGDQINAPQLHVNMQSFFADSPRKKDSDETIDSREFRLLLKPAATIVLGECPGEDCMHFKLGSRNEINGAIVQTIYLSGEGLGFVPITGPYQGTKLDGKLRVKGATMIATTDGKVAVDFPLKADTQFDIITAKYVVSVRLTEVSIENLKLRISYRFAKESDREAASDVGSDATFSEFQMVTGIPPPFYILDTAVVIMNSEKGTLLERNRDASMHVISHFVRLFNVGSDAQFSDFLLSQRWTPELVQNAAKMRNQFRKDFGEIVSLGDGIFEFRPEPLPSNARMAQTISWDSGRITESEFHLTIQSNFIGLSSFRIRNSPSPVVAEP